MVHERHAKCATKYVVQHVEVHFNYIVTFENELTELAEPTEQELERMKAEIEEAKKEVTHECHRAYRKHADRTKEAWRNADHADGKPNIEL